MYAIRSYYAERPVLTFDNYKVKPGDNLSTIAKRYDIDIRRIARENNLNKSNLIVAGNVITSYSIHYTKLYDSAFPLMERKSPGNRSRAWMSRSRKSRAMSWALHRN